MTSTIENQLFDTQPQNGALNVLTGDTNMYPATKGGPALDLSSLATEMQNALYLKSSEEFKAIWDNLSGISVKEFVKVKNSLSYVSWSDAWTVMMQQYPGMKVSFLPEDWIPGGHCIVNTTVVIGSVYRSMFLPVMTGYKNSSVKDPDARHIGDARMRCLVKNFALFGLGIGIYRGEDLQDDVATVNPTDVVLERRASEAADKATLIILKATIESASGEDNLRLVWKNNETVIKSMAKSNYDELVEVFKTKKESFKNGQ